MPDIKIDLDKSNGNDFEIAVGGAVKEYFDSIVEDVFDKLEAVGKRGVEITKTKSKPHYRRHRGKHYRTGWKLAKTDEGFVIHNKSKPHLTHILNDGFTHIAHGKRGQNKWIKGDKHIDQAVKEIGDLVDREIESLK